MQVVDTDSQLKRNRYSPWLTLVFCILCILGTLDAPCSSCSATHVSSLGFYVPKWNLCLSFCAAWSGAYVLSHMQKVIWSPAPPWTIATYKENKLLSLHQPHCYILVTQMMWAVLCLFCATFAWLSIGVISLIGTLPTCNTLFGNPKMARKTLRDTCDNLMWKKNLSCTMALKAFATESHNQDIMDSLETPPESPTRGGRGGVLPSPRVWTGCHWGDTSNLNCMPSGSSP